MQRLRLVVPLLLVSSLVTAIDQILKFIALKILVYGESISLIKGFFSLTLVFNTGAAFGVLRNTKYIFLVLPVLTVGFVLILFIKSVEKEKLLIPLGLLLGGSVGNFIDRIKYGHVIDFLDLYFRSWHWPAFNFADSCICFGVLLLFLQYTRKA